MRVNVTMFRPSEGTPALRLPDCRLVAPRVGTSKIRE